MAYTAWMAKAKIEYVYGINPCFELIRGGKRQVKEVLLNEAIQGNRRLKKLSELAAQREIPVNWVSKERLTQLSGSREHQGAVARTSLYRYTKWDEIQNGANRLLLLDNVEDPNNTGAILRSAEVFGFHDVLLPIKGVPEIYPSVVKTSAGASEHLRISREMTANNYVQKARDAGFYIAALDAKGDRELREFARDLPDRLLLVIGGEDKSVGQFILNQADCVIRIDQKGRVNSLNASVAAGLAMYLLQ